MADDFAWPCNERKPHAPHALTETVEECDIQGRMIYHGEHEVGRCPGVRAHPNTMIGRERRSFQKLMDDAEHDRSN